VSVAEEKLVDQVYFRRELSGKLDIHNQVTFEETSVNDQRYISEERVTSLISRQWENAEGRINTVAALLAGAKAKMTGEKISKALYALADEFGELGEKLSKPSSF
jgi:hypothetical protein